MAQIRYRANLSAKDFVFSSQNWGRSVILKQYDQNFSRQIVSPSDPDKDIGIPQIFYGHNIMPSAQGFQSVGYVQEVANTGIPANSAAQLLQWSVAAQSVSGQLLACVVGAGTQIAFYNRFNTSAAYSGPVATVNLPFPYYPQGLITTAQVNGITYIYIPNLGCYSWDGTTWSSVVLTGLTASQIIGITSAFGYMIAWSATAIAWSSTVSPTDFTPSLITGAGGGSVQGLEGNITVCSSHVFGFIVFGTRNCVAAVYSGNSRYPFNFRKIIGGGGIANTYVQSVALDSESGNLYAWTSAGLQLVSVTQAQVVFPELTNFLAGSRFEDFNDTTLNFVETDVTAGSMPHKLTIVSDRYLIISYAVATTAVPQIYTHAIIYDIAMKRWGKLKFTHVAVGEVPPADTAELSARSNVGFVAVDGSISTVDFSYLATSGGTIILGKYQHARDKLITLDQVDLEYVQNTANLTVYDMPTLDGKTFLTPVQMSLVAATNAPQYRGRNTGMNHSLIVKGIFQLDSLMLTYHASGRR